MKSQMKKVLSIAFLAIGFGLITQKAQAASTDTMTLSVTPGNITYGVTITSPTVGGYNFGQVNLGQTTVSTLAIVVTATGANVSEYFGLAVSNTSGSWTPGVAPSTDTFRMTGWFNSTQPLPGTFVAGDALTTSVVAAATKYNQASKTLPNVAKNLWLRLEMPTYLDTGTQVAQTMTLTVTGQAN